MASLSRNQMLLYGAIAVALLLIGARWIRAQPEPHAPSGGGFPSGSVKVREEGGTDVVVHVAGEVVKPGVYRLPRGSRVADAVERAGGAAAGAASEGINLAARLSDGQQVLVPGRVPGGLGVATGAADGPVSLGSATVEQLDSIEGIGPVTAQKIIDYRTQHGGISSIAELDAISGIGPATMQSLRARLQP